MSEPVPAGNKKKKIITGIGLLAVILVGFFIYDAAVYVSTDNAQIEAHSVMLASKVPGFVVEVKVKEGAKVKKGDILVEIDQRDYQNTVNQVKSELTSLQARKTDAEKNFHRVQELFSKGAVSQQQHDTATAGYSDLKAKFEAVSAQVAQAELNLENTRIAAPTDGFVAKRSVEVGQLANPGVPLIGFVGAEERWVNANFKETEIDKIKIGARAEIEVDAVTVKKFHGTVESISSATGATFTLLPPDNATGNFTKVVQRVPVKIKIEELTAEDIDLLRAGLSANIKVHKH